MNMLESWLETPSAHALAWALVHFIWQGALIAVLLAAAFYLFRPSSARARYALACAGLFAMPVIFAVSFGVWLSGMRGQTAVPLPGNAALRGLLVRAPFGFGTPQASLADRLQWLVPVWAAGVLLVYGRLLASWMSIRRMRRVGVCAAADEWQRRLEGLARRLRLSAPVVLLESCRAEVPVVFGYLRPVVLVPAGLLTGLPPEQVESILAHELAHIRRYDYFVNVLQSLAEGLLFYHPAVWWISGLVRAERENCADDAAVALTGDARGYAAALATLEQSRHAWGEPVLAATGGNLMKRIRRLLQQPERGCAPAVPGISIALLLVCVGVALAARHPLANPRPLAQAAAAVPADAYTKWLNEDVFYIITDAERAAFQSLHSDAEREHFIEQFWQRRDPTPGTPVNEFKIEHYRRIANANERFAGAGVPGWRTDRGHVYIVLGPPDEIESHPGDAVPYDMWRYRYVEGVGSGVLFGFVDSQRTGEYRLDLNRSNALAAIALTGASAQQPVAPWQGPPVSVDVGANGVVTIRVPTPGASPFNISGQILTQDGKTLYVFQETVRDTPLYVRTVKPMPPGVYRLIVFLRNLAGGAASRAELGFRVE